jgi:hypothetical protein
LVFLRKKSINSFSAHFLNFIGKMQGYFPQLNYASNSKGDAIPQLNYATYSKGDAIPQLNYATYSKGDAIPQLNYAT